MRFEVLYAGQTHLQCEEASVVALERLAMTLMDLNRLLLNLETLVVLGRKRAMRGWRR
jgi:hypothetical protein